MQLLLNIAHEEHKTVLLSTHDLDLALHTADRIWLFEKERGEKKEEEERKEEVKEEEEGKEEEEEKKTNGDKMSKIISGTPQELVSNGSISRFAKGA